jgi:hypothetical protein
MGSPNVQHSDKWSIIFSNIPGYVPIIGDNTDMGIFDYYVKEMTFPSVSLELVQSHYRNYQVSHQISKINDTLNDLSITFTASEGLKNYYHIWNYLRNMREMENVDDEKWFRLNLIKEIKLLVLDNEKRPQVRYTFINGFITDLTSLSLTNGIDEEVKFTITVKYEDHLVELITGC